MTRDAKKGHQSKKLVIAPGASVRAVVHKVNHGAEIDGRFVVNSDGPLSCDLLAESRPEDNQNPQMAEGHMASTSPGALGRASGVYRGANWTYRGGPIPIPEVGQASGYLVSGTKYQQKIQNQAPQALKGAGGLHRAAEAGGEAAPLLSLDGAGEGERAGPTDSGERAGGRKYSGNLGYSGRRHSECPPGIPHPGGHHRPGSHRNPHAEVRPPTGCPPIPAASAR